MKGRDPANALTELLVLRARGGDEAALATLYRIWSPRLLRHAGRLTDDAHGAADVAQEAWLAIARMLPRLDDPAAFIPWAYRIVSNKAADATRGRRRDRRLTREVAAAPREPGPSEDQDVEAIRGAIRRLAPEPRALLSMRHVDGLSVAQIGTALAIPVGTVKSRLHAARAELRSIIEGASP